jgi:hypothetical protein
MKHADRLTNTISPLYVHFMSFMQIKHRNVNQTFLLTEASLNHPFVSYTHPLQMNKFP